MPDDPYTLLAVVDTTPRWYAMTLVGLLACALLGVAYLTLARHARSGAPRLATCGLALGAASIVLMSAMHGFKLFLPTLADVTLDNGSTAVGDYIESTAFIPMIAGFIIRALAWIVLAVALVTSSVVRLWVGALIAAGAVVAFQLPAGPDAVGWVAVAAGTYLALRTLPSTAAVQPDQGAVGSPDRSTESGEPHALHPSPATPATGLRQPSRIIRGTTREGFET